MQLSLKKQLADAREEKCDLEKTYRCAVHEIKKLQEKLANHHIETEDGGKFLLVNLALLVIPSKVGKVSN